MRRNTSMSFSVSSADAGFALSIAFPAQRFNPLPPPPAQQTLASAFHQVPGVIRTGAGCEAAPSSCESGAGGRRSGATSVALEARRSGSGARPVLIHSPISVASTITSPGWMSLSRTASARHHRACPAIHPPCRITTKRPPASGSGAPMLALSPSTSASAKAARPAVTDCLKRATRSCLALAALSVSSSWRWGGTSCKSTFRYPSAPSPRQPGHRSERQHTPTSADGSLSAPRRNASTSGSAQLCGRGDVCAKRPTISAVSSGAVV